MEGWYIVSQVSSQTWTICQAKHSNTALSHIDAFSMLLCALLICNIRCNAQSFAKQELPHQLGKLHAQEQHQSWL